MTDRRSAAIVLAAGHGTRMRSAKPKVLHPLAGRPMIQAMIETLENAGIEQIAVVVGPGYDDVANAVKPHPTAIQAERLGTAHAALAAKDIVPGDIDDLLILNGDNPLIPAESIRALLDARAAAVGPAVVVLGFHAADPGAYGRMIVGTDNRLERIVEAKDATDAELAVDFCSSGMMALDGKVAFDLLAEIGNDNAAGEYYLPDVVGVARAHGRATAVCVGEEATLLGINSRSELAAAEAQVQAILRKRALDDGATLIAPETVFFSFDTVLGKDVLVEPNVFFGPGVTISDNVTIRAFSHLEGASVNEGAVIGPFARLRPGANLGQNVRIGNFVEIKAAELSAGVKVNHLSYVGDSDVGENANIGAGTITCNYDGIFKWRTHIGAGAFIGSNTALVAPVTVGDGASIGAGSTIAKDVAADALAVTRAEQREVKGWARKTRERKKALKAKGEKG